MLQNCEDARSCADGEKADDEVLDAAYEAIHGVDAGDADR